MPQTRRALLDAAHRHYLAAEEPATRSPRTRRRRPLVLGGAASIVGATLAAVLLLSAGGAPTAAQALPILATHATPVAAIPHRASLLALLHNADAGSGGPVVSGDTSWPTSWGPVHQFSVAGTTVLGYVMQRSDGSTLCAVLVSPPGTTIAHAASTCAPTASAEQRGLVLSTPDWSPGDYSFVALVPTGGNVTLTDDGTTTSVAVDASGIAGGVVHDDATVSVQVGSSVLTSPVGPSAQSTPTGSAPAAGATS
ncbi:MAG: hypothetical protein ACRDLP_01430 [Solirubrobacteraceae bacterium]